MAADPVAKVWLRRLFTLYRQDAEEYYLDARLDRRYRY